MKTLTFLSLIFCALLFVRCSDPVVGCTDPNAANYNPDAEESSGNCEYSGCMDPNADNFDENANIDSGNCIYSGCTDPDADNYDEMHNQEDGSCSYFDRYLGTYEGDFVCAGLLLGILNEATSEIIKIPGGGENNLDSINVIVSNPSTQFTLILDGVITKDQAIIDTYIENFEYTVDLGNGTVVEGPFEVFVTGTLDRAEDGSLSGVVSMRIVKGPLAIPDECTYTAIKI